MDFNKLASEETVSSTIQHLKENGFDAELAKNKEDALSLIKAAIPAGVSVMNGASKTLEEIGYIDYLKEGQHGWNNLHEKILKETDPGKQAEARRQAVISDYYLGSVHALSQTGEMVIASNTGSQLPHLVFTSPNIILVVGAQKITENLAAALQRLEEHVIPLEDKRMQGVYGFGTTHAKTVILRKENPMLGRKIKVIIVHENLGF